MSEWNSPGGNYKWRYAVLYAEPKLNWWGRFKVRVLRRPMPLGKVIAYSDLEEGAESLSVALKADTVVVRLQEEEPE